MPLDPSIALGVKGVDLPNPLAQYGQIAQIQHAQNQNALAQYQLSSAQRADELANTRVNALRAAGADTAKVAQALLSSGDVKGYSDFMKAQAEQRKADTELVSAKLKQSRDFLDTIDPSDPNAPALYLKWHQANHADPILGPQLAARGITAKQSLQRIQQALNQGPAAFAQLLNQSKLGVEKFLELNKPSTHVIDQSGQKQLVQTPGLGGAPETVGTYADVPLPANVQAQKMQVATAGAPRTQMMVNAYTPASETAQAEFMKGTRQTYDTLKQAPVVLKNIEEAKKLIPSAKGFMGSGGEPLLNAASFLNNRLGAGIDTKGVTDASELRSRLFSGVIENLRKLDANPTENQQNALREALGSLGTDPKALPRILDAYSDALRTKVDLHNTEVAGAVARGVKFPYDPTIKLPPPSTPAAAGPNIDALLNKYK